MGESSVRPRVWSQARARKDSSVCWLRVFLFPVRGGQDGDEGGKPPARLCASVWRKGRMRAARRVVLFSIKKPGHECGVCRRRRFPSSSSSAAAAASAAPSVWWCWTTIFRGLDREQVPACATPRSVFPPFLLGLLLCRSVLCAVKWLLLLGKGKGKSRGDDDE